MVNKKYAGFTMLECLVALVVLSCMCQLFQLMIQQSFIGNQYLKNNGKGYQPLLIGIKNGQFKNEGQSFTLEVTFTSGKTFDSFFPIKGEF